MTRKSQRMEVVSATITALIAAALAALTFTLAAHNAHAAPSGTHAPAPISISAR